MIRLVLRLGLGGLLLVATLSLALAQDADKDDFRKLLRPPETALEHWIALKFELDVGRPDLAATYLRGLLTKKPTDKDLLPIVDRDGMTAILQMRNVIEWSKVKIDNDQAKKDAEELITLIIEAVRKRQTEPTRIRELIKQLSATPEERIYAVRELIKGGAAVVPYLVEAHINSKDAAERLLLRQTIGQLGPETLPPLLAALDSDNVFLKLDLLDIFRQRHVRYGKEIVPHLWYLSAAKTEPDAVREKATKIISDFLEVDQTKLQPAKFALTREAAKYYRKKIAFADKRAVEVWRWEGKGLVQGWPGAPTVSDTQAEEYFGLRFARQALQLDPTYRPAQEVFLALAVDKAMEKAGLNKPLAQASPATAEIVGKADPDLLILTLDRAMKEERTGVTLALVRALGDRAEVRSKRPLTVGGPVLLRALYYPEPRVQFAAAEALLRMPGPPEPKTAARIVEILARALSSVTAFVPGRKVLVAIGEEEWRTRVQRAVVEMGGQPVPVSNERDAMRQLRSSSEIEAILLESTLPGTSLAHTLAQFRQDVDVSRIPILLAAVPTTPGSREAVARYRKVKDRYDAIHADTSGLRRELKALDDKEASEVFDLDQALRKRPGISTDQRNAEIRQVRDKYELYRKETYKKNVAAVKLLPEERKLENLMNDEARRYDLEVRVREAALERFVERLPNVQVVHSSLMTDSRALESALQSLVRQAGVSLTPAEQKQAAEKAIDLLTSMAEGRPAGYDVRPAINPMLEALRAGRVSPDGQLALARAAARFTGDRVQPTLATVVLDAGRPMPVRVMATKSLILNAQRNGVDVRRTGLTASEVQSLAELAQKPGTDGSLKEPLDNLVGVLRPSVRTTGERLREYQPTPVAPLPPPKKE